MKISLRTASSLLLFVALLFPFPASAQQDENVDEDEGWGQLIVEYGTWVAQPGGMGNDPASIADPTNAFNETVIGFSHGTSTEDYVRFGAELAGNRGRILITWYGHDDDETLSGRDPGNFIFGQLLSYPAFAGLSNDGLADAFSAQNTTALRDLKIEFSRIAFSNSRVVGRWSIGFRKVKHRINTAATYYALVPNFPAFVPPLVGALPNLTPLPETAELFSSFLGVGLTGGMEFEAPLWRDKFSLEGSFGLSVLQGDVDTSYAGTNYYYSLAGEVLNPPYSEFADFTINSSGIVVGTAASVSQEKLDVGLRSGSLSRSSQVLEVSMGARWNALPYMDVYAGYRAIHYGNVGVDLRPRNVVQIGNVINTTDASETTRSLTYQGFYAGVGFQF